MALTVLAGCNRSREPAGATADKRAATPIASPGTMAAALPDAQSSAACAGEHDEVLLTAARGGVIACWSEVLELVPPRSLEKPHMCLGLDATGAAKPAAEPMTATQPEPALEVRGEGALASVCMGARCRKLG